MIKTVFYKKMRKYILLFIITCFSCGKNESQHKNKTEYFDDSKYDNGIYYFDGKNENNNIPKPEELKRVKLNLYTDKNHNLYIMSDKNIFYDDRDTIKVKKIGLLLTDSIAFDKNNTMKHISKVIDSVTYQEIVKNLIYRDKNNIYYIRGSQYLPYPVSVLDLSVNKTQFLKGYYIKDNYSVYSYGGVHCVKIDDVDANSFSTFKVGILENSIYIYLGKDKNYLYQYQDQLSKEDLLNIPIEAKIKDSLINLYFK